MDLFSLLGIVIALTAILAGNALEGGELGALFDLPALIIVLGGTLGAVVLQTPILKFRRAIQLVLWVVRPPQYNAAAEVQRLTQWSKIARREGLLGLEDLVNDVKDPFLRRGLELVVDGCEPEPLRKILENDNNTHTDADLAAASVYRSMGGYAPTIGILGAVIGLIQVMGNLANPDELGAGIATAFVATIYGVGFANLIFLPVADRLKTLLIKESNHKDLYIEGLVGISEGEHPTAVEMRMQGIVTPF